MPTQKVDKVAEPTTLAIVAAGATVVSAAFTTLGYFAQRAENRRIVGLLSEIKSYLISLHQKVDEIKEQNREILKKLDQLPGIVERLLREETLNQKYSALSSIENDYYSLPGGDRRYRINRQGWITLNEVLTFIVKHEFRISKAFTIIQACEFSLSATELLCTPVIKTLLSEKIAIYNLIKNELYENVFLQFTILQELFINKEYILEHNFDENLDDLHHLKYTPQPEKPTTESYNERVLDPQQHQEPRTYTIVTRVGPSATGIAFNKAKTEHLQTIKNELELYRSKVDDYKEIRDIIKAFEFYLNMISIDYSHQKARPILLERELGTLNSFSAVE